MSLIEISEGEDRVLSQLWHGQQPSHFDHGAEFRRLEALGLIERVQGVRWVPTELANEVHVEQREAPCHIGRPQTAAQSQTTARPQTPLTFAQVNIEHGPVGMIGRALLEIEEAIYRRGVQLEFASMDQLLRINKQSAAGWLPLVSIFDPRFHDFDQSNSFFIVGKDAAGDVVACQAARRFDWNSTHFAREAESLRLFYQHPEKHRLHEERCTVTALAAQGIRGTAVFSGAAWLRKDFRRKGIFQLLPRLCRAYAHGLWDSDVTLTMMSSQRMKAGGFLRPGYPNVEWAVEVTSSRMGDVEFSLQWIKTAEMLEDTERLLLALREDNDSELDI